MKRILSLALAVIMIISCIPLTLGVSADEAKVVWVDSVNGSNATTSGSEETPYATIAYAMNQNKEGDLIVKVLANEATKADNYALPARTGKTTITSADPSNPVTITIQKADGTALGTLTLGSDVTFSDINIAVVNTSLFNPTEGFEGGHSVGALYLNGFKLTLHNVDAPLLSVFGYRADGYDAQLELSGDTHLGALYSGKLGNNNGAVIHDMSIVVTMNDTATLDNLILGCQSNSFQWNYVSSISGNVVLLLNGGTITKLWQTGRMGTGTIGGNVEIFANGGVLTTNSFAKDTEGNPTDITKTYSAEGDATVASVTPVIEEIDGLPTIVFAIEKAEGVAEDAVLFAGTAKVETELTAGGNYILPTGTSLLSFDAADAVKTNTVYVDATLGNDTTGNGLPSKPYATVAKALSGFDTAEDVTVVVISTVTVNSTANADAIARTGKVKFLGLDPANKVKISIAGTGSWGNDDWNISSPVTFENIQILQTLDGKTGPFEGVGYFNSLNADNATFINCDLKTAVFLVPESSTNSRALNATFTAIDSNIQTIVIGSHHNTTENTAITYTGGVEINLTNVNNGTNVLMGGYGSDRNYPIVTFDGNVAVNLTRSTVKGFVDKKASNAITGNFTIYSKNSTLPATLIFGGKEADVTYPPTASFANGNASAQGTVADIQEDAGKQLILPENKYTLADHYFTGWNDGAQTYPAGASYTMPETNVVFTAQWAAYTSPLYVSASGNDTTGWGTAEKPLATITKALELVPNGDVTIKFVGDYVTGVSNVVINRADASVVTFTSADITKRSTLSIGSTTANTTVALENKTPVVYEHLTLCRVSKDQSGRDLTNGTVVYAPILSMYASTTFKNVTSTNAVPTVSATGITVTVEDSTLNLLRIGRSHYYSPVSDNLKGNVVFDIKDSTVSAIMVNRVGYDGGAQGSGQTLTGDLTIIADNSTITTPYGYPNKTSAITGALTIVGINGSTINEITTNATTTVSTAIYNITVSGGTVTPVLTGATLDGFTLTPDNDAHVAYVNGEKSNTINVGSSNVVFATDGAGLATVSFAKGEATGEDIAPMYAGIGSAITLPGCNWTLTSDKYFAGWSDGETTYAAGASYTVAGDITLTAVWGTHSTTLYLDPAYTGEVEMGTQAQPFKTLAAALAVHPESTDIEIVLVSTLTVNSTAKADDITRTGKIKFIGDAQNKTMIKIAGSGSWDGDDWNISSPVTFENIQIVQTVDNKTGPFDGVTYFNSLNADNATFINCDLKTAVFLVPESSNASRNLNATFTAIDSNIQTIVIGAHRNVDANTPITYTGNIEINLTNVNSNTKILVSGYGSDRSYPTVTLDGNLSVNLVNSTVAGFVDKNASNVIKGNFTIYSKNSTLPASLTLGGKTAVVTTPPKATFVSGNPNATGAVAALEAEVGETVVLPENGFTYVGHYFTGWTYGGKTYAVGDEFVMVAGGAEFTAVWGEIVSPLYVSTSGNDTTGWGTAEKPLATITKAMQLIPNGDLTIILKDNCTFEANTTLPARTGNTTITSANKSAPVTITIGSSADRIELSSDLTFDSVVLVSTNRKWYDTTHDYPPVADAIATNGHLLTLKDTDASLSAVILLADHNKNVPAKFSLNLDNSKIAAIGLSHAGSSDGIGATIDTNMEIVAKNSTISNIYLKSFNGNSDHNRFINITGNVVLVLDNTTANIIKSGTHQGTPAAIYLYTTNEGKLTNGFAPITTAYNIVPNETVGTVTPVTVMNNGKLEFNFAVTKAAGVDASYVLYEGKNLATVNGENYVLSATSYLGFYPEGTQFVTVGFDANGGTGTDVVAIDTMAGKTVTLPESTWTTAGKYFAGWSADGGVTVLQPGTTYTVSADTTFVAQWKQFASPLYVSTSGSDTTGWGTAKKPLATIEKALECVPNGALTIKLSSDYVLENTLTRTDALTIESASDRVTLTIGKGSVLALTMDVPVTFNNLTLVTNNNPGWADYGNRVSGKGWYTSLYLAKDAVITNCDATLLAVEVHSLNNATRTLTIDGTTLLTFRMGKSEWGSPGSDFEINGSVVLKLNNATIKNLVAGGHNQDNNYSDTKLNGNLIIIADGASEVTSISPIGVDSSINGTAEYVLSGTSKIVSDTLAANAKKTYAITYDETVESIEASVENGVVVWTVERASSVLDTDVLYANGNYVEPTASGKYVLSATDYLKFAREGAIFTTVSFDANGGTGTAVNSIGAISGDVIVLPECTWFVAGKYFAGWFDSENVYAAGANYTVPAEDIILQATYATYETTLYLDPQNVTGKASDKNGGTQSAPFATLAHALAIHSENTAIEIVLLSELAVNVDNDHLDNFTRSGSVKFMGLDAGNRAVIRLAGTDGSWGASATWIVNAPVTFENIAFESNKNDGGSNFVNRNFFNSIAAPNATLINCNARNVPFYLVPSKDANFVGTLNPEFNVTDSSINAIVIGVHANADNKHTKVTGNVTINLTNTGSAYNPEKGIELIMGSYATQYNGESPVTLTGNVNINLYDDSRIGAFTTKAGSTISGNFNIYSKNSFFPSADFGGKTPVVSGPTAASFVSGHHLATGTVDAMEADKGEEIILPECGFAVDTAYFTGWKLGETVYAPGDTYVMGDAPVTFTAQWAPYTGNVLYVSATGKDYAAGTQSAPLATIEKALKAIPAGNLTIKFVGDFELEGALTVNRAGAVVTFTSAVASSPVTLTFKGSWSSGIEILSETVFDSIKLKRDFEENDNGKNPATTNGIYGAYFRIAANTTFRNVTDAGTQCPLYAINTTGVTVKVENSNINALRIGRTFWDGKENLEGDITILAKNSTISALKLASLAYNPAEAKNQMLKGTLTVMADNSTVSNLSGYKDFISTLDGTFKFINVNGSTLTPVTENATDITKSEFYYFEGHEVMDVVTPVANGFEFNTPDGYVTQLGRNDIATLTEDGVLNLPTNTPETAYTVYPVASAKGSDKIVFHLNGGKAIDALATISDMNILQLLGSPDKENSMFLGWTYAGGAYYNNKDDALSNFGDEGIELYAKWKDVTPANPADINQGKNTFVIRGVQVREKTSEIGQALRFIVRIDTENLFAGLGELNGKNGFMAHPDVSAANGSLAGFGTAVAATVVLDGRELRLDETYNYNGKTYTASKVPANKKVGTKYGMIDYTVALTNMKESQYQTAFTVRPYIQYYTPNGQLATVYGESYSISLYDTALYIYTNANEKEGTYTYLDEYVIKPIDGVTYTSKLLKDSVETQSQNLKNSILNAANVSVSNKVYYVSNSGKPGNSGTSEGSPWDYATLQANLQEGGFLGTIQNGSTILFKRGEVFRGNLLIDAAIGNISNLTLSAYGEGNKPIITTSPANLATKTWTAVDGYPNVYVCEGEYKNVGNMVFNSSFDRYNTTDELMGWMLPYGYGRYKGIETLASDLQFYSDLETNKLYLYSAEGNPANRFNSIEIGIHGNIINVNGQTGITISNLDIRHGGSHAIATTNANNLRVENCVISYIGGSVHGTTKGNTTLFGNAVEAYGNVNGFAVTNNWIYQIYDTGITQQNNQGTKTMTNSTWSSNLIEHTHWPFEYWNNYDSNENGKWDDDSDCSTSNLHIENNIVRTTGYGFGSMTRAGVANIVHGTSLENVTGCYVKNNIFDRTKGYFTQIHYAEAAKVDFEGNTYIAEDGVRGLSWYEIPGDNKDTGFTKANKGLTISDLLGDSTAKIYFYK